jgi:hypothetical protein
MSNHVSFYMHITSNGSVHIEGQGGPIKCSLFCSVLTKSRILTSKTIAPLTPKVEGAIHLFIHIRVCITHLYICVCAQAQR